MKKTLTIVTLSALAALSCMADCNYTFVTDSGCYTNGSVVTSTPVRCHWSGGEADLYDMTITEEPALTSVLKGVSSSHPDGYDSSATNTTINIIDVETVTTDPATCIITTTRNTGQIEVDCPGNIATGNPCQFILAKNQTPEVLSFYSLAFIAR